MRWNKIAVNDLLHFYYYITIYYIYYYQELNAEADRIIDNTLLPAKSRQRYEQVYKLFIELPYFVTQFFHETF